VPGKITQGVSYFVPFICIIIMDIKFRIIRWVGELKKCIQNFSQKTSRKKPLRLECRWKNNIEMGLRRIKCALDSNGSGHGPMTGFYEHSNESSGSIQVRNFFTSSATINF
jgi:hypothetical protein